MIELRKFQEPDFNDCAKLFLKVFSGEPWYDKWESIDTVKKYLGEFTVNPMFKGFVAIEKNRIVGVCFGHKRSYWRAPEFQIDEMYVDPVIQGEGVGTKLIGFVKDYLKNVGIDNFVLITGKDLPAENFYVKNGFYRNDSIILMNYEGKCNNQLGATIDK